MDQTAALLALLRNTNAAFQQPAPPPPQVPNNFHQILMMCLGKSGLTSDQNISNAMLEILSQQQQQLESSNVNHSQKAVKRQTEVKQEAVKLESLPFSPSQLSALKLNLDNAQLVAPPLSSTTSVDEGIMTSSPTETASGSEVDDHDLHSELPKEAEKNARKRPGAIQDLLLKNKKRARLDNLMTGLAQKKKETNDGDSTAEKKPSRPNSTPNHPTDSSNWAETFGHILSKQDDDKTTALTIRTSKSEEPSTAAYPSSLASFMTTMEDSASSVQLDDSMKKGEDLEHIPDDWLQTFNEVYEGPEAKYIPPEKIFAQVPGRLSLLSNVVKYKMTVAEVRRRLLGPEAFNFSLLGALLRRAKMPEKSRLLLAELRDIGLAIPRGRRRAEKVTLLSALTEAEAEQLCVDFGVVSDNHFPIREFATLSLEKALERDQLKHRLVELHGSRNMIDDYIRWLEMDRSEIRDRKPKPVLPNNLQDPLSTYSMLTHGFGTSGLLVGVRVFRKFISEQITLIESQMNAIK